MMGLVDDIVSDLLNATVPDKYFHGEPYKRHVLYKQDAEIVRAVITTSLGAAMAHVAEMEAKITVYESIIKNSNFAPMITKEEPCQEDNNA